MTIDKFNKILQDLAIQPRREKIFELAAALIEWMGFEFAENNKPRLLAPQTQKLKENLFPVPGTVQPQLYRLTSDGQQIRVRFAVLKKPKKDFIRQLVDGDVGLSSYQASMRGIIMQNGREPYISPQPYFVHFITTPEYKWLYAIFNTGDQKRIISFRNRLTQTQFNKILPQWQNIAAKTKPEMAELFWKSLDLKELNKDFYKLIKEQFDALIGIAKTQYNKAREEDVKQFAVRLIGRYIFCWFLKEKEIIPDSLLSSLTIQKHKTNYFQTYLKQLFFKTLNEEVQSPERKLESNDPLNVFYQNIPYLNGGLFETHPEDFLFDHLDLNNWLIAFTQVLESFDFTVDESSSQYQQVAIDPEMLGRIFENLLASQNPETERMANQRKAFGAFYTPREIVDYMVDESLKAHLKIKILPKLPNAENSSVMHEPVAAYKGTLFQDIVTQQAIFPFSSNEQVAGVEKKRQRLKDKIDKLFAPACADNPFDKSETIKVREALANVSILDPACGSGAFPMGILLRLMELRQIVGHGHKSSYDLKAEILSRNIYGVDIMPMAIEIARLRAWLSLVLEANYKPTERKNNFGIAALPNLDFKFVCANNLIDVPENKYVEIKAENDLIKFKKLTKEYFSSYDYKKIQLKKEIIKCINSITEFHEIAINRYEQELNKRKNNKNKNKLKKMYANQKSYEMQRRQWLSYKNIFENKTVEFFNTKYFFPAIKDGFDVVIGNPPYIKEYTKKNAFDGIRNSPYYQGKMDLWYLFACNGLDSLKYKGLLCFIATNNWLTNTGASKMRNKIIKEAKIERLLDFGSFMIFESADIQTMVMMFKNETQLSNYNFDFRRIIGKEIDLQDVNDLLQKNQTPKTEYLSPTISKIKFIDKPFTFSSSNIEAILQKIEEKGIITLDGDNEVAQGIVFPQDFVNKASHKKLNYQFNIGQGIFGLSDEEKNSIAFSKKELGLIKPYYTTEQLGRYYGISKNKLWLIYTNSKFKNYENIKPFPNIKKHIDKFKDVITSDNKPYGLHRAREERFFKGEKIITLRKCANKPVFTYTNFDCYVSATFYVIKTKRVNHKFLVALLNSTLIAFWLKNKGKMQGNNYQIDKEPLLNLPIVNPKNPFTIIDLVNQILQDKSQNQDTIAIEHQIDILVYKLYEVNYDEVKEIDPDFWLSEEEYKNFK